MKAAVRRSGRAAKGVVTTNAAPCKRTIARARRRCARLAAMVERKVWVWPLSATTLRSTAQYSKVRTAQKSLRRRPRDWQGRAPWIAARFRERAALLTEFELSLLRCRAAGPQRNAVDGRHHPPRRVGGHA